MTELTMENFATATSKARASEGRKSHMAERRQETMQMVFAVRLPAPSTNYGWEVRRFGSIVLSRSQTEFRSSAEAKTAGEAVLASGLRSA